MKEKDYLEWPDWADADEVSKKTEDYTKNTSKMAPEWGDSIFKGERQMLLSQVGHHSTSQEQLQ